MTFDGMPRIEATVAGGLNAAAVQDKPPMIAPCPVRIGQDRGSGTQAVFRS